MARNRTLRPVFPRLPFVFGTVSAERFADSFGCHCQHVLRHIDVTPLPRACVDQKPGTGGFQSEWHMLFHVLPTLIYHASVDVQLCFPSFGPFCKLSFGMVHMIMIDSTTTCYLWIGRGPICNEQCFLALQCSFEPFHGIPSMRTCYWTLLLPSTPRPTPNPTHPSIA